MVDDGPADARRGHQLSDARSTLAVAAPTLLTDLHISPKEYSWILNTFQVAIMMQPLAGLVMDTIGLKLAMVIFATAWSLITMAHGLAHNWQVLAGLAACSALRKDRPIRRE